MRNSKGIATVIVMAGVFAVCLGASYIMATYFGPDNVVQNELEEIAEDEAEVLLHAPDGSLHDEVQALFPHKRDSSK